METTRLKHNLIFINLKWFLGVQMDNNIFKILSIVFLELVLLFVAWGVNLEVGGVGF